MSLLFNRFLYILLVSLVCNNSRVSRFYFVLFTSFIVTMKTLVHIYFFGLQFLQDGITIISPSLPSARPALFPQYAISELYPRLTFTGNGAAPTSLLGVTYRSVTKATYPPSPSDRRLKRIAGIITAWPVTRRAGERSCWRHWHQVTSGVCFYRFTSVFCICIFVPYFDSMFLKYYSFRQLFLVCILQLYWYFLFPFFVTLFFNGISYGCSLLLSLLGIPDAPQTCQLMNTTAYAAVIECLPGYLGGEELGFAAYKTAFNIDQVNNT